MEVNETDIWDAYNLLLLGPDVERLRKLLVRYDLFQQSLEVPGDIVECGVFKGAGLLYWMKLLEIYAPGSAKRVVGFDLFSSFPETERRHEQEAVEAFVAETGFAGVTVEALRRCIVEAGLNVERCDLVAGDVCRTAARYVAERPGFRISLLHLDLDLEEGTYAALEAFWPRVVRGGVVIFDQYAVPQWTESNAVDRFLREKSATLKALPHGRTPTAYVIKQT